jgi:hypothetical protein
MSQAEGMTLFFWLSCFFLTGLFLGWALTKRRYILLLIGFAFLTPIIDFTIRADYWLFTVPLVVGFLVHTARPIYYKVQGL